MITLEDLYDVRVGDYLEVLIKKIDGYYNTTYYLDGKRYKVTDVSKYINMIYIETESEQGFWTMAFDTTKPLYYYEDYFFHSRRKNRMDKIKTLL